MIPVLFVFAAVFVVYAVCMFAHKGPLPCFHYFMLDPKERAEVLTPREYRNAGVAMLLFALACVAGYAVDQIFPQWLMKYVVVLGACFLIYVLSYDLKPKKWEDLPESKIKRGGTSDIL